MNEARTEPVSGAEPVPSPVTIAVPDVKDPELKVIGFAIELLSPLTTTEQARIIRYLWKRFGDAARGKQ